MYVGNMLMVDTRPRQKNAIFAATSCANATKPFDKGNSYTIYITFQVRSAQAC